jgi:dihydrofolate synthase/folylpolyglutamate synthase
MAPASSIPFSYEDALSYLDGFTNYERRVDYTADEATLGTGRMRRLLTQLGDPQNHFRSIHIAGSKGKGSTAIMTAAILRDYGYRVGLYTSPHLVTVRERIVLAGAPVDREAFRDGMKELMPAIERVQDERPQGCITYFETLTALAFLLFRDKGMDLAVVETGLGGRFDATNVLTPSAVGITPVSMDHMKQLGNTISAIAGEKAGIIKPGVPVLVGPQVPEAETVFRNAARHTGAPLRAFGTPELDGDLAREPSPSEADSPQIIDLITWRGPCPEVPLPLIGRHQAQNAALAVGLAEVVLEQDDQPQVSSARLRRAWRNLRVPGRIEIIGHKPWTVLDGAHNAASAWVLADTLRRHFATNRFVLVFGSAEDKDIDGMFRILAPMAQEAFTVRTGATRSADPDDLARMLQDEHHVPTQTLPALGATLEAARQAASPEGLVCITGSLYLVGRVQALLAPEHES